MDLAIDESDIIRLILEYLSSHQLSVSSLTLERESGIVNGKYSNDSLLLDLRRLILDGQWDDVINFVQPLSNVNSFDMKQLLYVIHRQKYLEMLSERNQNTSVNDIVKYMASLENLCPSKVDYDYLCSLLPLEHLSDHVNYKDWNPLTARMECFENIYLLVVKFLPFDGDSGVGADKEMNKDRLIQLLVKGLLYETCVEFCQCVATSSELEKKDDLMISSLLKNVTLGDCDMCLISWLTALPCEVFSFPFERKSLKLRMSELVRPQIQVTDYAWKGMLKSKSFINSNDLPSAPKSLRMCTDKLNSKENIEKTHESGHENVFQLSSDYEKMSNSSIDRLFETSQVLNTKFNILDCIKKKGLMVEKQTITSPSEKKSTPDRKTTISKNCMKSSSCSLVCKDERNQDFKWNEFNRGINIRKTESVSKVIESSCKDLNLKESDDICEIDKDLFSNQEHKSTSDLEWLLKPQGKNQTSKVSPKFVEITRVEDDQVIRSVAFHPNGHLYVVGSNSKILRVCRYPMEDEVKLLLKKRNGPLDSTDVIYTDAKHHRGSIYCVAWNQDGQLIATGSNDQTIRISRFCHETLRIIGKDVEVLSHDGTVRDLVFVNDIQLVSGGAGDSKIYLTNSETGKTIQTLTGHSGYIYSLYSWDNTMVVSGSQDGTACIWDLRMSSPADVIPSPSPGSAFASVCVDASGYLMASGHEDWTCMLWDIRKACVYKSYKPHNAEIRSVRFSTNGSYLLTGSYDHTIKLTDLHDSNQSNQLSSVVAAKHRDKVIQCRWHPKQMGFVSTSVDKTVACWILPNQDNLML